MAADAPTNDQKPEPRIGSYRLVQPLGTGGMSSVFRALHVETGSEVAVKILPRNLARNRTLLQRFLREAKSAEALEHPNIVAIYDHGLDNGQHYLVLEFVPGGDLHDWVRSNGPMPVAEAIAAIRSVCEGLKFAAGQGLIHRDIKPANLLRSETGAVKIADLGLALQAEDEDERVTREGTTVGTVDYMAPEQARDSRGTSERSDIYSLGCTFYFLLTGQPPFPGGDVTEKLTRHFTATPPDPGEQRPDVPEELSRLVRKMMAKRPENRFANYDELIAGLDAIPLNGGPSGSPPEVLDALFDDEEDDSSREAPLFTLVGGSPEPNPSGEPAPLYALVDDEDDDDETGGAPPSDGFLPLDLSEDAGLAPIEDEPRMVDVSMAELASMIDDDEPIPVARTDRPPVRVPPSAPGVPLPAPAAKQEHLFSEEEEETLSGKMPGHVSLGQARIMTDDERAWLKGLIFGALGLFIGIIGFHQLWTATGRPSPESGVETEPAPRPRPVPAEPEPPAPPPEVKKAIAKTATPKKAQPAPSVAPTKPVLVWSEPLDEVPSPAPEVVYGHDVEAKYLPEWALSDVPTRLPGKTLRLRRLADPRDPDQKRSLVAAFEVISSGSVEISDDGPFFESDLRIAGEVRLVRSRPGYRAVVCLQRPRLAIAQQKSALIELDSKSLILDGLDLVVDAKELQGSFASIFLCRGGSLTLRNCTVTILNRNALPFSVVQTGPSDKPSRVRLEQTLVRGAFSSVVDLAAGLGDVVISRSAVVNSHGAVLTSSGSWTGDRRVFLTRSVLATRGSAFEMADPPPGVRARPVLIRALGSTFARLGPEGRVSFLTWRGEGASAAEMLSWQGASNTFAGWSDWLSVGSSHLVRIANLASARAVWPGTDVKSAESPSVRPLAVAAERVGPAALRDLAPDRPDVLSRLPVATPYLTERTVESFPTPVVPGFAGASAATTPGLALFEVPPPPNPSPPTAASKPPGVRDLVFDAEAPAWSGDLGRFLATSIVAGDTLVRVRVTGSKPHAWTPVSLPDGVSLDLFVSSDTGGRSPSWSPIASASASALIAVRGGSLVLNGVVLTRDGGSALSRLIRVEGGHLVLHHCSLTAPGVVSPGGGGLIEFRAPGSKPLVPDPSLPLHWPFDTATDRPTCRVSDSVLITGGEVITIEMGRGLAAFSQCAIAAGESAFALRPAIVARHRFDVDLWLDRCTVASERSFVSLGPWYGTEPGPNRPWLVSTHRCGFFGTYSRPSQESVLLRVEPESFAHGAIFWQGRFDAFEVPHFAVSSDVPLPAGARSDVARQWADLWGLDHIHAYSGPHPPAGTMTRWLVTRPLRPGDVVAADLGVDPTYPKDDPPKDLGVDLSRLGITPVSRTRGRR